MEPTAPPPTAVVDLALVSSSPAQVLLHDHTSFWQSPQVRVNAGQSCRSAVRDAARRWWQLADPRIGDCVGVPWSRPPELPGRGPVERRRLVLVLLPPGIPRPHAGPAATPASWWPVTRLVNGEVPTRPAELAVFLDGYLQGWLPDGQHALDW
ncbi:hypothetical protein J7F02_30030 [Streptomyces sp. ISL-112]|uniref:hypothetical protein n=2 Tax=unclassified Streptomyces TaxID=2593676 RepID=UPI001BE66D70|nr:hypothetical protein [Streptomyces sp. ISL-63]MBT2429724.1 hypothetical protein [Streptomyces sp. ISL-112]MBT2464841.1 hypothetical protein [Streptomyces sp. ISL-63]